MNEQQRPAARFVASPVDYEAWQRGYMPPTSHLLIHKLMGGELVPRYYTDCGPDDAWALVAAPGADLAALVDTLRGLADVLERRASRLASSPPSSSSTSSTLPEP